MPSVFRTGALPQRESSVCFPDSGSLLKLNGFINLLFCVFTERNAVCEADGLHREGWFTACEGTGFTSECFGSRQAVQFSGVRSGAEARGCGSANMQSAHGDKKEENKLENEDGTLNH